MYVTFSQNNSGGHFVGQNYICIECESLDEANQIAIKHGIYFQGVFLGKDCECCGDRWMEASYESELTQSPEINGSDLLQSEKYWRIVYKNNEVFENRKNFLDNSKVPPSPQGW